MAATTKAQQGGMRRRCFFVVAIVLARLISASSSNQLCALVDGRCPPGFVASGHGSCICPADQTLSLAIDRCNEQNCSAYLRNGFWVGYVQKRHSDDAVTEELELYTGKCPRGYCKGENEDAPLLLPRHNNSSNITEELNQAVCGTTRKGPLCGECRPDFGPGVNLFLAPCVHCAKDSLSQVGWLLWLMLEVSLCCLCWLPFSALILTFWQDL